MSGWIAGAAVIGAVVGSQGQQSAANTQAAAATNAANTQAASSAEALALQKQMFDKQMELQEPYRQAGLLGQNRLMELLGLGGSTGAAGYGKYAKDFSMPGFDPNSLMRNFGASDFQQDPGYAFRLSEGLKGLDRQAAARGGLISGGALKAATKYGQEMGSQEYQNAFNRFQANRAVQGQEFGNAYNRYQTDRTNQLQPLGNLQALGQSAASNQGSSAGAFGSAGANLVTGAGTAQAAGINAAGQSAAAGQLGAGNTWANALNTGASAYQNQQNFNNWLNRSNPSTGPSTLEWT